MTHARLKSEAIQWLFRNGAIMRRSKRFRFVPTIECLLRTYGEIEFHGAGQLVSAGRPLRVVRSGRQFEAFKEILAAVKAFFARRRRVSPFGQPQLADIVRRLSDEKPDGPTWRERMRERGIKAVGGIDGIGQIIAGRGDKTNAHDREVLISRVYDGYHYAALVLVDEHSGRARICRNGPRQFDFGPDPLGAKKHKGVNDAQ